MNAAQAKSSARPPAKPAVFAILAGGGNLPAAICTKLSDNRTPTHILTFTGQPQPQNLPQSVLSVTPFALGAVGRILAHLKSLQVTHVALAGNLNKPSLFNLKPDLQGLQLLNRVRKSKGSKHDDALLTVVAEVLQEEGFSVVPVSQLAPELLATPSVLSKLKPTLQDEADIALALAALESLGKLDIGQSAIVHQHTILGLEAVEGTDALIERCANLRGNLGSHQKAGLLVKVAKPGQTNLADLPTVGPATLEKLATHRYRGLVVQAGATLLLDQPAMVAAANRHNLLLMAVPASWKV